MAIVNAVVLGAFRCPARDGGHGYGYGLRLLVDIGFKEDDTCFVSHYRGYRIEWKFSERNRDLIYKIIDVVGVESWACLTGHHIRVKEDMNGESIKSIGNLLRDDWVDLPEVKDK